MRIRRIVISLTAGTLLGVGIPATTPTGAAPATCNAPTGFAAADTFTWIGTTGDWGDSSHWDNNGQHAVPGARMFATADQSAPLPAEDVEHQFVCLPDGAVPTLSAGESASIDALDLIGDANLTVVAGGKLFVGGAASSPASDIGPQAELWLEGGELGGFGTVDVDGLLRLTGQEVISPDGTTNDYAAAITTRECEFPTGGGPAEATMAACPQPLSGSPGHTVIEPTGRMLVDGPKIGGVNILDRRDISSEGTITFANTGFFAMDFGTSLESGTQGQLAFDGTGGIYEGFDRYGPPAATVTVEGGKLLKQVSNATVVVAGVVAVGNSTAVRVTAGLLWLNQGSVPTASVSPGNAYGEGACAGGAKACRTADGTSASTAPQGAFVRVPRGKRFTSTSNVHIAEGARTADPIRRSVVLLHSVFRSTRMKPSRLSMIYSADAVRGRSPDGLSVQGWNGKRYADLPGCSAGGTIPGSSSACFVGWQPTGGGGLVATVSLINASRLRAV